jgi:uncharacterized small protein (DUF1192 family)
MTDNVVVRLRSKSPYLSGSSAERTMEEAAVEIENLAARIRLLTDEIERLYRALEPKP